MTERKFGIFREVFLVEKDCFSVCKPSPWLLEKRNKLTKKLVETATYLPLDVNMSSCSCEKRKFVNSTCNM